MNRKSTTIATRCSDPIHGVLHRCDRLIFSWMLPVLCYAEGMTAFLKAHDIRTVDYPKFAEPLRDMIRRTADTIAEETSPSIEFIRSISLKPRSATCRSSRISEPSRVVMACARMANLASQRAFAKAGFRDDREFDDVPNGRYVLMVRHRQEVQVA